MIEMQKRERMIIWEGDAGLWDNEAYLKFCAQEGNPIVEAFTGKKKKKPKKLAYAKTQVLWSQIDKHDSLDSFEI